jgi:L-asparaginase
MTASPRPQTVVVLGTGGTIAGTAGSSSDAIGYTAAQLGIEQLIASAPALSELPIECEQIAQVNSKDMTHAIWQTLGLRVANHLARADVAGIVITHGTDTLEETAWFLQRVLAPAKPVVLTAAMRPATSLQADGPQNLLDAVTVVRDADASGVLVAFCGSVHGARRVRKAHPYRLDAFDSGDAGALAVVEDGKVRWLKAGPYPADDMAPSAALLHLPCTDWPRVEILFSHAGSMGDTVRALCSGGAVRGLVIACTGNGTLNDALEPALLEFESLGVAVLRSLRCGDGRILPVPADIWAHADDLSPVKARVDLMVSLVERAGGAARS